MKLFSSKSNKGKRVIKRNESNANKAPVTGNKTRSNITRSNIIRNNITSNTDIDNIPGNKTRRPVTGNNLNNRKNKKRSVKKRVLIIASSFIGLILLFTASTLAVVRWEIQPMYDYFFKPDMSVLADQPVFNDRPVVSNNPTQILDPSNPGSEENSGLSNENNDIHEIMNVRKDDYYTFLVLGIDADGNTDVIKVAGFDAAEYVLNIISIPRDTIVNVPWNLRKVNSIHAAARNKFRGQNSASDDVTQETLGHFRNLLGFNIDFMITISMAAFPRIVDAIGPIEFNVPVNVSVDDVNVPRGVQRLNGQQALAVMRDRNSHSSGDIGRANTQQQFLNTIMRQFLANRNNIKVDDMANIFLRHTNTNIQLNNLVWFGREFLKMDSSNINFYMMPGDFETLRGNFYISVHLEPWLELINDKISPLNHKITETDVSILTRGSDRRLYVTDDNWLGDRNWGGSGTGSSNPHTTTGG